MSATRASSPPEAAGPSGSDAALAPEARRLHRRVIETVLATGSVPSVRELADRLETTEDAIRSGLTELAIADYIALDEGGQVSCLYPFSTTPTSHVIVINGQPRYAMCSIDALGIPAMLGQELDFAAGCALCDRPIRLRVAPGAVVSADPATAMVVARRDEAEPAFAACCPFTVFVCGHQHAEQFVHRIAGTLTLSLDEAFTHAEKIFAGLLAEDLPAHRPRGKNWDEPGEA
jgi:hypothetical protein